MLDAAMTVHERKARQIFVAGGEYHGLRGICSLYGIGHFRLADLVCVCFELIVYKTCMHLCQIYASQESINSPAHFVLL